MLILGRYQHAIRTPDILTHLNCKSNHENFSLTSSTVIKMVLKPSLSDLMACDVLESRKRNMTRMIMIDDSTIRNRFYSHPSVMYTLGMNIKKTRWMSNHLTIFNSISIIRTLKGRTWTTHTRQTRISSSRPRLRLVPCKLKP